MLLDDDEKTQTAVIDYLQAEGYAIVLVRYGRNAFSEFERVCPDLILLDVVFQDEDGVALINQIRSCTASPILVISEKKDILDKIVGLEMGADDSIEKPFEMRELLAQIKANLRLVRAVEKQAQKESAPKKASILHFGHWYLDLERHELLDEERQPIDLTRDRGYEGFDRAVDVQISRIRKKIGDDNRDRPYIKTIRGIGYMLDAEITVIE